MVILDRYVGKAVAAGVLTVIAVLVALYTFIGFAGEFDRIGQGQYTMLNALEYTLARMPFHIYEFFPLAALLGTMVGLGALAGSNELVAMRAAGVSSLRLLGAVMKAGLLLMLAAFLLGEVIAPPLNQHGTDRRVNALAREVSFNTQLGLWARDGDIFVNIRRVDADERLVDINLFELDAENRVSTITRAATAHRQGDAWLLQNVTRRSITSEGISTERHPQLYWRTLLQPGLIRVVAVEPQTLALWDLKTYVDYLHDNGLDAARYELAMWAKIASPFAIGAMVLLAAPVVFGSLRSVGAGTRIMVGFLIGIGFYLGNNLAGQIGLVYNLPPLLSASAPTFLVLGAAIYLLRRVR